MSGWRGTCLCEYSSIITDWLPQQKPGSLLSLCIGKAASAKVTQRNARNISRARGANVTSKPDYDDISRGKGREHNHDLYARAQQARDRSEESTRLMIMIGLSDSSRRRGSPELQLCCGNRLLASAGDAVRVRCVSFSGKEFANVIQFRS
jgi:hypothetical protein